MLAIRLAVRIPCVSLFNTLLCPQGEFWSYINALPHGVPNSHLGDIVLLLLLLLMLVLVLTKNKEKKKKKGLK